jgi:hypothetical protein
MTDTPWRQQDVPLFREQHDLPLMDSLRALWRDCIERVRRGADLEEWDVVNRRIAELERQLPD